MSDSNNITVLNPGLYKNLLAQIEAIYKHSNELSFKTRARYFEATKRFCKFLADNYRLQNFKNVEDRHFKAYVEHLKENNSAATIQSDLSGIVQIISNYTALLCTQINRPCLTALAFYNKLPVL